MAEKKSRKSTFLKGLLHLVSVCQPEKKKHAETASVEAYKSIKVKIKVTA